MKTTIRNVAVSAGIVCSLLLSDTPRQNKFGLFFRMKALSDGIIAVPRNPDATAGDARIPKGVRMDADSAMSRVPINGEAFEDSK